MSDGSRSADRVSRSGLPMAVLFSSPEEPPTAVAYLPSQSVAATCFPLQVSPDAGRSCLPTDSPSFT